MGDYPNDHHFWKVLLRRIARRTRSRDEAEDLLHAAFIRLERYRAKHAVANPSAFLVKTAVNIGIDRHRHERFLSDPITETDMFEVPDDSPTQDEVIDGRARLERVKAGLARLSPRTRDIFLMHRLDGVKYREIALRLGLSESSVEKHIAKAALFLGEWMEGW